MIRRDIVIVDILILLSSGINPVNFFLSSTFLRSAFISSFYQSVSLSSSLPSRFLILLCLSIVPVLSHTALLLLLPSSSSVISPFPFFILPLVPTPSSFLLPSSSSSFTDLLLFPGFIFFLRHLVRISAFFLSFFILLYSIFPFLQLPQPFFILYFLFYVFYIPLYPLVSFLIFFLLYTRWYVREIRRVIVGCEYLTDTRSFLSIKGLHVPLTEWPNAATAAATVSLRGANRGSKCERTCSLSTPKMFKHIKLYNSLGILKFTLFLLLRNKGLISVKFNHLSENFFKILYLLFLSILKENDNLYK